MAVQLGTLLNFLRLFTIRLIGLEEANDLRADLNALNLSEDTSWLLLNVKADCVTFVRLFRYALCGCL